MLRDETEHILFKMWNMMVSLLKAFSTEVSVGDNCFKPAWP